jgi:hypothetical protein
MRLIYVEWVDSSSVGNQTWVSTADVIEATESAHTDIVCRSAGFLIKETSKSLAVAAHMGVENISSAGHMIIPKSAIRKRRWLSK